MEIISEFIRQIYRVETGAAIDIKSSLAREKLEKSKTHDGRLIEWTDVLGDDVVFTSYFLDEIQGSRVPSESLLSATLQTQMMTVVVIAQTPLRPK